MADKDFDWIDDAFDDKKTAEDIERAKGPKLVGFLFVLVLFACVGLVVFGVAGIVGSLAAL